MKVYEFDKFGIENLRMTDAATPEPAEDEVLVKVHSASLNFRDLMVVGGRYNPRMRLPVVPLSDAAGKIVAVGKNVVSRKVGERVMPLFVQKWFDGRLDLAASRS